MPDDHPTSPIRFVAVALAAGAIGALIGASVALRFQQPPPKPAATGPAAEPIRLEATTVYTPANVNDIVGWSQDSVLEALPALRRSCDAITAGSEPSIGPGQLARPRAAWAAACAALVRADSGDSELRAALAQNFTVYRVAVAGMEGGAPDEYGTFTGYYEAELNGALTRGGNYQFPIYGPPRNLIAVNVKDFLPNNTAVPANVPPTLIGRVVTPGQGSAQVKPYYTRAEIDSEGVIADEADVLAWADDPVAVHILHIQGSGQMKLPDGQILRLGYAGSNGHAFRGLGQILRQAGVMQTSSMSMIVVREWLRSHPDQATELMNKNARYIFFRKLDLNAAEDGPLGAQGVSLTAGRSLAVDPRFLPLGAPVWVDTKDPDGVVMQRLMVAQDVGSAITGPVRGDIFWGHGEEAFLKAGRMRSQGSYYVFIPNAPPPA